MAEYDLLIRNGTIITLSGWHGVTTVAIGNCGFGFAPVRPEDRERAMLRMERTETIYHPASCFLEALRRTQRFQGPASY